MSSLSISASAYSNTAPLIWSFLYGSHSGKYELILDNAPARSAEFLLQNRVDVALVPMIAFQLNNNVKLIPEVCIGSNDRVRSVCLVTKGMDLTDVKSVSLDISSKTSVALTEIIFREFLGFAPIFTHSKPEIELMLQKSDCALLIGDPALTLDETRFRKFDLVELWRKFTGFGFVFAMWMTNAGNIENVARINFKNIRDEGLLHLKDIFDNYHAELNFEFDDFSNYLTTNIVYSIDDSMQKGLELYFNLAAKHGLIETAKPLEFI